jgi:hypothetical protein
MLRRSTHEIGSTPSTCPPLSFSQLVMKLCRLIVNDISPTRSRVHPFSKSAVAMTSAQPDLNDSPTSSWMLAKTLHLASAELVGQSMRCSCVAFKGHIVSRVRETELY